MAAAVKIRRVAIALVAVVAAIVASSLAIRSLPARLGGFVEKRLDRETGLRWRVGHLTLDPFSGLVLRDVGIRGEDGLEGHVGTIVLAPSVSVLLGRGGPVRAEIEAAGLTLALKRPVPVAEGAGPESGALANLSAIRATVRGAGLAPVDQGRALALSADRIEGAIDLAEVAVPLGPDIHLDLPDRGLSVAVGPAAPDHARAVTATLTPGDGRHVSATTRVLRDGSSLKVDPITGTIDQAPFSGSLLADLSGVKPHLDAAVKLDALMLTSSETAVQVAPSDGIAVPLKVARLPDLAWLAGFDGRLGVSIQRLAVGPIRASAVVLAVRTRDEQLDVTLDGAAIYGGTARGRYVLASAGRAMRHEIGFTLSGVRAKPLLSAVGASGLDGAGNARIDIGAQGLTVREVLASAVGRAEVAISDGSIDGFSLARAAGLTRLGGGLATRLDRLGAQFTIEDGRATTDDLRLKTNLIGAQGSGILDFESGTMDLRLKPIAVVAGGRFDVPIRISGPWGSPSVDADLSGLARDPASLLEGLTNLGTGLMGADGGEDRRAQGRLSGRDRGGRPSRGEPERRERFEDVLDSLLGRRDSVRSRP